MTMIVPTALRALRGARGARSAWSAAFARSASTKSLHITNLSSDSPPGRRIAAAAGARGSGPAVRGGGAPPGHNPACSLSTDSSNKEDISALLARELAEEESTESTVMPGELAELKGKVEGGWRIVDGATVRMYKKDAVGGGAKVSIVFHCQESVSATDAEALGEFGGVDGEGEEEESGAAVRFTAMVSRAGKTVLFSCVSEGAEAEVDSVAFVEEEAESFSGRLNESLYQGPVFDELAEDLQESFTTYLQNDCGVDSDVASFIVMYADYREQVEYVEWLKGLKSLISTN